MNIPSKKSQEVTLKLSSLVSGTGKTSFCNVWTNKEFKENMKATIMTEFNHRIYKYKDFLYKVQLWTLAVRTRTFMLLKC